MEWVFGVQEDVPNFFMGVCTELRGGQSRRLPVAVTGTIFDQTSVPVAYKPIQLRSQPAAGSASDPQMTGPRETSVWPAAKSDGNGSFNVTSSVFSVTGRDDERRRYPG